MARGINNGDVVLGGFELPESNVDGDTTFTLSLQLVQNPGVLEGTFTHFLSFLLKLLDCTFVDTAALVDQVAGSRGLAGIDVSNNDNVDMGLFLSHGCESYVERLPKNTNRYKHAPIPKESVRTQSVSNLVKHPTTKHYFAGHSYPNPKTEKHENPPISSTFGLYTADFAEIIVCMRV